MKFYFEETGKSNFNAGFKARYDVDAFLKERGYQPLVITIFDDDKGALRRKVCRLTETHRLRRRLSDADELFFQYPLYTYKDKPWLLSYLIGRFDGRMTVLIHDIPGYRDGLGMDAELAALLKRRPTVIAHTPAMARRIEADAGLPEGYVKVLNVFDYRTADAAAAPNPAGRTVIFAGNLAACGFLSKLDEIEGLNFNIYGVRSDHVRESDTCRYCGKFAPENVSMIEGDWGLVWHGPDIDTSAGNIGEYLRIIASHKISLYIAAGKPVIVWDQSSVAQFLIENHLGIAVASLRDIPAAIAALTDDDRARICDAVNTFSQKLRDSAMLAAATESD